MATMDSIRLRRIIYSNSAAGKAVDRFDEAANGDPQCGREGSLRGSARVL
jgi:hypothetical protein